MQDSGEYFQAIDDAWARAGEVRTGVDQIDLAILCGRKRIEPRKFSQQLVIASGKIDIVPAEGDHDHLRAGVEHLLPIDLRRRLMFAA